MLKFNVTGMSCAACSARVEKAVSSLKGVELCSVNLLTNSMVVEGVVSADTIIDAVRNAGYGATLNNGNTKNAESEDTATHKIKKRLLISLVFLVVLMYFSMGHAMFGLPLPLFFENNPVSVALVQLILSLIIMIINSRFYVSGFKAVINRSPNMDTLVSLGSSASFLYSVYAFIKMLSLQINGDIQSATGYLHELYFESAAMILVLITVGKMLESRSKGKTTDALKGLIELAPKTAVVLIDGKETEIPASSVKTGDIFIVRPGQGIAVDGVVLEGESSVDESSLTGESIPSYKTCGDTVSSGTINCSGYLKCEASRVGEDTTLSQIIRMVSDAAASKAPIAKVADKVSGVFVPVVLLISLITFIGWMLTGESLGFSVARAISVLVISCPCALGLATPVAIMVGSGVGAKNGILFKTATSLEQTGKVDTVVLDKTGTITVGKPVITDIILSDDVTENELLTLAYSIEVKSEHPLAQAVVNRAEELRLKALSVSEFHSESGSGISGIVKNKKVAAGNLRFVESLCEIDEKYKKIAISFSDEGKTPLWFACNNKLSGIIAVADVIKHDSPEAIKELKNMGIRVVMLTGDNEITANAIGREVGVDEVIAGVLPGGKELAVRKLQKYGRVAMVGDGINDSPALTRADIGIAIGSGTDIAVDAADIILMKSSLCDVSAAIRLSRATLNNIHLNLFWAFIYNIIGIPLAAGLWYNAFGLLLNPMFGAAAMSVSSFCVVMNALRLNLIDIHSSKHDRKKKNIYKNIEEEKIMEKTVKIEGMMCPHCEARVKTILEELAEVDAAAVSHQTGTAVLTLNAEVSDEKIKSVIEAQGYKVIG